MTRFIRRTGLLSAIAAAMPPAACGGDDHGATVRRTADGELRIRGARVDADHCTLQPLRAS